MSFAEWRPSVQLFGYVKDLLLKIRLLIIVNFHPHQRRYGPCKFRSRLRVVSWVAINDPVCDTAWADVCGYIAASTGAFLRAPNGAFFRKDLPPEWWSVKSVVGGALATCRNPDVIEMGPAFHLKELPALETEAERSRNERD